MHIACLTNRETSQNMYQHHQHLLAYDVVNLIFKHQLIARNSNDKTPHVHMYIYMYTHTCICLCMCLYIYVYMYSVLHVPLALNLFFTLKKTPQRDFDNFKNTIHLVSVFNDSSI